MNRLIRFLAPWWNEEEFVKKEKKTERIAKEAHEVVRTAEVVITSYQNYGKVVQRPDNRPQSAR